MKKGNGEFSAFKVDGFQILAIDTTLTFMAINNELQLFSVTHNEMEIGLEIYKATPLTQ